MVNKSETSIIGKRLLQIRQQHNLSLRELEAKAGTSASLLSQIENGKANPSVMTLQNIATALGVPVKYFFDAQAELSPMTATPKQTTTPNDSQTSHSPVPIPSPPPRATSQAICNVIVTPDTRASIELEGGVIWERLTVDKEEGIEFLEVIYEVGANSGPALAGHHGRECALILEGELLLEIGQERHILQVGDSMTFDSMIPHRVTNVGQIPLRVFWGNLSV